MGGGMHRSWKRVFRWWHIRQEQGLGSLPSGPALDDAGRNGMQRFGLATMRSSLIDRAVPIQLGLASSRAVAQRWVLTTNCGASGPCPALTGSRQVCTCPLFGQSGSHYSCIVPPSTARTATPPRRTLPPAKVPQLSSRSDYPIWSSM